MRRLSVQRSIGVAFAVGLVFRHPRCGAYNAHTETRMFRRAHPWNAAENAEIPTISLHFSRGRAYPRHCDIQQTIYAPKNQERDSTSPLVYSSGSHRHVSDRQRQFDVLVASTVDAPHPMETTPPAPGTVRDPVQNDKDPPCHVWYPALVCVPGLRLRQLRRSADVGIPTIFRACVVPRGTNHRGRRSGRLWRLDAHPNSVQAANIGDAHARAVACPPDKTHTWARG
ncbi:hypothetical protein C8R44DRAFT_758158 [Mycena epipterygia]|nr:hypothetical protein C8R44DRAFT_758158 [Mycena epipterygia]